MARGAALTWILALWAIVASVAAVFLALQPHPETGPAPKREMPRAERRPATRDLGGRALEAYLALALPKPEAPKPAEDGKPPSERVLELLDAYTALERSDEWTADKEQALLRELYALVAWNPETHRALMARLESTEDPDEVHNILSLLVFNPWVGGASSDAITEEIENCARALLTSDANAERRRAAAHILFRYGRGDRKAFDFGLERLEIETDVDARDALLEEMTVAGTRLGLSREEAAPFVDHLRDRLAEGELWTANALADWSTDAEDFERIKQNLEKARGYADRSEILNALRGNSTLVRDRADEAKEILIRVLSDPAEDPIVRDMARRFLTATYGPLDAKTTDAVRRYDAEQRPK